MSREGGRLDSNILVLIVDDVKGGTEREKVPGIENGAWVFLCFKPPWLYAVGISMFHVYAVRYDRPCPVKSYF